MAKGLRRNAKPRADACLIKSIAIYYGNLCVHLQDAETSQKIEQALENLKIDEKIVEKYKVGDRVVVAITTSGKRKFRRAVIDTLSENLLDATDLETDEYYADVDRRSVYSIKHLKDQDVIEAAEAVPYYIHGYHNEDNIVSPKQLEKLFRHLRGVRWVMQKTGAHHAIDEEVPVVKLFTENNRPLDTVTKIKTQPRQETTMPMLFTGTTEEVRVFHSERTMGVQLRYLPLHELRRLEVFMTEGFEPDFWRLCEPATTNEGDLVAAFYNGRRVRGYVVEVRPGGTRIFLMDYGVIEKIRYQNLWHLPRDFASKLPRYGLQVQLPAEPEDFFDDCTVEISLASQQLDELTLRGEILRRVDETEFEPLVGEQVETEEAAQRKDGADDAGTTPSVDDSESGGSSAALQPESLSPALANYLGSTSENFVVNNDDRPPPVASPVINEAPNSAGSSDRPSLPTADQRDLREDKDQLVEDRDLVCEAPVDPQKQQEVSKENYGSVAVDRGEILERQPAAVVVCENETAEVSRSKHEEPEASGDRNRENISEARSSSHASPKYSGDSGASSFNAGDKDVVKETTSIQDEEKKDEVQQPEIPSNVPTRANDSERTASELDASVGARPEDSQKPGRDEPEIPDQPESAPVIPIRVVEIVSPLSMGSSSVDGQKNEEDHEEAGAETSEKVVDSAGSATFEFGDSLPVEAKCKENPGTVLQPEDPRADTKQVKEPTSPLPQASGDAVAATHVSAAVDDRKIEVDQNTEMARSEANPLEDISVAEKKSEESQSQTLEDTGKPRSARDQTQRNSGSGDSSKTPTQRKTVKVEQSPAEAPKAAQASAQADDFRQADDARVPDFTENIKEVSGAESPVPAAVTQKTPEKPKRSAGAKLKEFEGEAQLHDLTIPFISSDNFLIVQVGKSQQESTGSNEPENQSKTVDREADKPSRTSNDPEPVEPFANDAVVPDCDPGREIPTGKVVDHAEVPQIPASAPAKRDLPESPFHVSSSATERMKALISALHEKSDDISVPDVVSKDTKDSDGYVEGQFDDADDGLPLEKDQETTFDDRVPEENRVVPEISTERLPEDGSVDRKAEQNGNEEPANLDAVVSREEEIQEEISQESMEDTAAQTDVGEHLSTCDSLVEDPAGADQLEPSDAGRTTQTIPQDVLFNVKDILDETRVDIAEQATAATTADEPHTAGDSCSKSSEEDHLNVDDAQEGLLKVPQHPTELSAEPQVSEVPNEVRKEDSSQEAMAEASVSGMPAIDDSRLKHHREGCFERDGVRRGRPEYSLQNPGADVEKTSGSVRKKNVDKAVAGPSAGRRPSQSKSDTKVGTKKSMSRTSEIEHASLRLRDVCEFPKLTIVTGKLLLATITRIVNERNILMTHSACLASIEEQLGDALGNPAPENFVRAGKTVLVEHENSFRRAGVAGMQQEGPEFVYYVYLLDYPECLRTVKLYECPPAVAAMPRALLFVQLIGSRTVRTCQVGNECKLLIDRFDGSMISGIVLPIRESSAVK